MMNKDMVWRLPDLIQASGLSIDGTVPDCPIRQVTDDSRDVRPDALFVAVKGSRVNGHRFLDDAIARGARVVLIEEGCTVPPSVVKIRVKATRPILGPLAHTFLGSPSKELRLVGVTGTNGKTTVAWLIQHLLEAAHMSCGLVGTVCHRVGQVERPSGNTTPGVVTLQGLLSEMVENGTKACAMEVSSHALDQYRTEGLEWAVGVFTNLSPEHLDYHGTLERYLQAKLRLFQALSSTATAVINRDDPAWRRIQKSTKASVLTYSLRENADLVATDVRTTLQGTECRLITPEGIFPVSWSLIGLHNLENLLAAVGALMGLGVPVRQFLGGVETFAGVPGRLERIDMGQPFSVFVDYAHTDGALQRVLEQLRRVTDRRILVVFGCGGDRDRTKRPRMGQVASTLADRVIITSDNPRSEDPRAIAEEVASGIREGSSPWEIILDRKEAIRRALVSADENWVVLIAGKGHERGQIFGNEVVPFDDLAVVRECLAKRPTFSSNDITAATQGVLVAGQLTTEAFGISIDSRTIEPGELFVAIRGDRFDGHDFVQAAFDRGAVGAVVDQWPFNGVDVPVERAVWRVADTLQAFGELAHFHRRRFSLDLVAITGSTGKTSTKMMLAHLLSKRKQVLATTGTQNNLVGVPLTLLKLRRTHDVAVVELGTNRWGEIRRLTELANPTVGVITNIGPAHLETFGDLSGVLREKVGLWETMDPRCPVVLNADDPFLWEAGQRVQRPVIWFSATKHDGQGSHQKIDIRASQIVLKSLESRCLINDQWEMLLPLPGYHNLINALAALAGAYALGEDLSQAVKSLQDVPPIPGRLVTRELDGWFVLDDTYNANPASLKAALEVFKGMECRSRRIGVIGDMLELGNQAQILHQQAGEWMVRSGMDYLITVGSLSRHLLAAAREAGFPAEKSVGFATAEEAGEFLSGLVCRGDTILLKGSRGMHMERVLIACSTTSSIH